ncbi:hypothetical protein CASFOL_016282 [Castilleja foliolosa]|uniref:Protein kinase domain-containing protein n=1 Tax=Castilleja foliolosa TaxID=1961234 RepID=A0ABD3DJM5_9LAMI
MEGEPELPASFPPEAKFFRPDPTHPINIHPDSFNLSRTFNTTSSSTTSSSSSSPPDLVRHAQAAFKRHRPLGMMQSNGIKPRRFLVSQQEKAKESNPKPESSNDAKKSKDDIMQSRRVRRSVPQPKISGDNHEDASITPPSEWGTTVNTLEENPELVHTHINKPGLSIRSEINDAVASAVAEPGNEVAEVQRKVHFSSENIATPLGADDRMATGTDDLLSHMNSLALTETEWDVAQQGWQHHNIQNIEIDNRRKTSVQEQFHQFGTFFQNDLSSAMTQSSAVGSSCVTSTLINSTSAPMISSTTYCSQHQTGGVQLDVAQPPNSLSKPAVTLQPISSNPAMSMEINKSYGLSKDYYDTAKDSCYEKSNPVKENVIDVKSQPPSSNLPASDVKLESSKSEKVERGGGGGGKATSTSRRKGYDPDLFFKVNGKLYQRLGKIGSGGSSEVHKVISSDCTIYALKKIKLKGRDYATAFGFCQEIEYLNRLKGKSNIIQLVDYEVTDKTLHQEVMNGFMSNKDGRVKDDGYIYMVLEYGEIDLAHMLAQKWRELEGSNEIIDENWLRFYWQQILLAVTTIHEERIVHSDLKPANFLLVRGSLKLIDFGIAKAIMSDTTNIQRDSQVGTLSYMSPEAFMCNETDANGNTIKCGRPSDIWSLGCILYQMVYGRTPFSEYKTFWAKFKVITDPTHEILYEPVSNPWLLDLMKKCLAWDRNERWRIPELLKHPFLVPPVPNKVLSPIEQKHTLFQLIAESSVDDQKALMLCSQLQSMVMNPRLEVESGSLTSRDQFRKLLCKISNVCIQLQDEFAS